MTIEHPQNPQHTPPIRSITPTIDIYIKLAQYPILSAKIRARMRQELFRRGIIEPKIFEKEVKEKATESQHREGLYDPFGQEQAHTWQKRRDRIREFQTDAYFANNLSISLLDQIIEELLANQPGKHDTLELTFNPEVAPWEILFRQGEMYEALAPQELEKVKHHLQEIKVVLIKGMISDQLQFIGVAKHVLSIADLRKIFDRRIGSGKIGGKSAGMVLAWKILQNGSPDSHVDISKQVDIPDSFFVGSEVIYDFRLKNNIDAHMTQKYRELEDIRKDFPMIEADHLRGDFPEEIEAQFKALLIKVGDSPLIVRSSSLLEDNFGFSFAGKYSSFFCPNQGTPEENLIDLMDAVKRVYASTINPDAILYRQHHGLIDYDERMGVLIQRLQGEKYGRYFFPTVAGVGFSQNPFRWHPKITRHDGFLRIVWGMGTRAVDRVANDYPRMIALSHPKLRPETTAKAIRQYSQYYIDLVDLEQNEFTTVPVADILDGNYPFLRYIASDDKGDYIQPILTIGISPEDERYVITFDAMLKDKKFVTLMRTALTELEKGYKTPVDVEFAIEIIPKYPYPEYILHLLQCRPLSHRNEDIDTTIPLLPVQDILFTSKGLVPVGIVENVQYVIFVDPEKYRTIPDNITKLELGRIIGRLNKVMEGKTFILIGPGRWGSSNLELGVRVSYADIFNTRVLVELAVPQGGKPPELSYGTHFFQDLVESSIFALPIHFPEEGNMFDWEFFRRSPNRLATLLPEDERFGDYLRVVNVPAVTNGRFLNIIMDGTNSDTAVAYLKEGTSSSTSSSVITEQSSTSIPD